MFHNKFNLVTKIHTVLDLNWGILNNSRAIAKRRNYHALSIRLEGDATIDNKKNSLKLSTNDILFVPKNTSYHLSTRKPEHVICIHFDMPSAELIPKSFTPTEPEVFIKLFNQINDVWTKKEEGYRYKVHSLFNSILFNIIIQQNETIKGAENSSKLLTNKIAKYLKENFYSPELNVSKTADKFFISQTYMRRLFKKHLGCSPIEYITNLRLKYATELLKSEYYTVEQVAEKCGLENTKYFSSLYKAKYGIQPSKVAKQ